MNHKFFNYRVAQSYRGHHVISYGVCPGGEEADLKSVGGQPLAGSNPVHSAKYTRDNIKGRLFNIKKEINMLMTEETHCFNELRKLSIKQAQMECVKDFYINLQRFAGKELDDGERSLANYNRFDCFCGKRISYNNKNVQFSALIPEEQSTELIYRRLENNGKEDSYNSNNAMSIDEELTEKGVKRLCESVELSHPATDAKQKLPRYRVIFGIGEFPYLNFKIARIGNKEYFWYTLTR